MSFWNDCNRRSVAGSFWDEAERKVDTITRFELLPAIGLEYEFQDWGEKESLEVGTGALRV